MRLSARAQQALRLAGWLALGPGAPLSLEALAAREGVSRVWVEQVMADLRRAGIVTSSRGVHGGFVLGRPAGRISLGDVLEAVGEHPATDFCTADASSRCVCPGLVCVSHEAWERLEAAVSTVLRRTTLADLCHAGLARVAQTSPLPLVDVAVGVGSRTRRAPGTRKGD